MVQGLGHGGQLGRLEKKSSFVSRSDQKSEEESTNKDYQTKNLLSPVGGLPLTPLVLCNAE